MDDARLCCGEQLFSRRTLPAQGEQTGSGFHSEFLGPKRVGASISNQGAFFHKASTEAAAFSLAAHPLRIRNPGDFLS